MKIGFIHRVARKTFQGPTHGRVCATVARSIRAKTKDYSQGPNVSSMTNGSAPSCYSVSPVSGTPSPHVSSLCPEGPGPRDAELLCVSFPHLQVCHQGLCLGSCLGLQLPGPCGCYVERVHEQMNEFRNKGTSGLC